MNRESPFLTHELLPLRPTEGFKVDLQRLLRDSPFAQSGIDSEAAAPSEWSRAGAAYEPEWEQPGCSEEQPADFATELFEAEAWGGSAEQIAFRDRVLAAHIARSKAARGAPQRDLTQAELTKVPGTNVWTLPATAAAAGRLLQAANQDLKVAQQAGDSDALRTVLLSATSGYRGSALQEENWIKYFSAKGGYYDRTQIARAELAEGPHSAQAVAYMLNPGGFGLGGRVAAPGYSNHQGGIAIDWWQQRIKGHAIENKSDKTSRARWYNTWFHKWLRDNAATQHHFKPIATEEWHWEYRPPAGAKPQARSSAAGALPVQVPTAAREQVMFAQRVLNATEGERLSDDGVAGAQTRGALLRFRTKYRLGSDAALDAATQIALLQRALEVLAQASMFTQYGKRDSRTDQALASFKAQRGMGLGSTPDAAVRLALTDALVRRGQASAAGASTPAVREHLGGKLWTFTAAALPMKVAVFVPKDVLGRSAVEVLLFAHGLVGGCPGPKSFPDGFITDAPFNLGTIVAASGRPMVLVVPQLDWDNPGGAAVFGNGRRAKWHALGRPQTLNAVLAEVLVEVGRMQAGQTPALRELILAGHSRAYDFLEPLADSRGESQMRQGALAKLTRVWAFDTTYTGEVSSWIDWLKRDARLQVAYFYQPRQVTAKKKEDRTKPSGTAITGQAFYAKRGARLEVTSVSEGHCSVPARQLPALLKLAPLHTQELAIEEVDSHEAGEAANEFDPGLDSREAGSDAGEDFSAEESMPPQQRHYEWAAATHQHSEDAALEQLDSDLSETLFLEPFELENFAAERQEFDEYEQSSEQQSEHSCCGGGHS